MDKKMITKEAFEEIAQGWDGCRYDDAMIDDIGAALRRDFDRLATTAGEPVEPAQVDNPTAALASNLRGIMALAKASRNWYIVDSASNGLQLLAAIAAQAAPAAPEQVQAVPHSQFRQAVRAIQGIECPYNEKDHGQNWHSSAHSWDMAMISAIRSINQLIDAAPSAAAPAAPEQVQWISIHERLPECDMKPGALGVEVIVYPKPEKGESTAFYGCRISDEPDFYKYGSPVGGVTHWMPLPAAPSMKTATNEGYQA